MGAWGPKLYDNDVARDLRDAFADLARLPLDGGALVDLVVARHPSATDPTDDDHTSLWLALADQLHRHGIAHAPVFERAYAIVDQGDDDRAMAALDMSPSDRRKRAKALAELRAAWGAPHPKPVKRKVLRAPEPHDVAPGEIWVYPTEGGNPPNTYFPEAHIARTFRPDGWNAFAVGAVGHQLGYFALAYFARLHVESPDRPDLDACIRAPITGVRYLLAGDDAPPAHGVGWATVTKAILRKMRAERLGRVDLSWDRIRARLNGTDGITTSRRSRISGFLTVHQAPIAGMQIDRVGPLEIRLSDVLG